MAWGSRAWGFDADAGAFAWDEEGIPPGDTLWRLMGMDQKEEK
jgi:hypothetical protein